jgi:hypothetical protein
MNKILEELLGGAAGKLGELVVEAGASMFKRSGEEPDSQSEQPILLLAPALVEAFFAELAVGNKGDALNCVAADALNDDTRAVFFDTLDAGPPISWQVSDEIFGPSDWDGDSDLPWVEIHVVATYEDEDAGYVDLHASLWIAEVEAGPRIVGLAWEQEEEEQQEVWAKYRQLDASASPRVDGRSHLIPCTRCPQSLRIPSGAGTLRVQCPTCWTYQTVRS